MSLALVTLPLSRQARNGWLAVRSAGGISGKLGQARPHTTGVMSLGCKFMKRAESVADRAHRGAERVSAADFHGQARVHSVGDELVAGIVRVQTVELEVLELVLEEVTDVQVLTANRSHIRLDEVRR